MKFTQTSRIWYFLFRQGTFISRRVIEHLLGHLTDVHEFHQVVFELIFICAKDGNFSENEFWEDRFENIKNPIAERPNSKKDQLVLSFREILISSLWKFFCNAILKVVASEVRVVSYQNILIDIPFHMILKVQFNDEAIVIEVLFYVCYERREILICSEEQDWPPFVIFSDVLKNFERVIVIERFKCVPTS